MACTSSYHVNLYAIISTLLCICVLGWGSVKKEFLELSCLLQGEHSSHGPSHLCTKEPEFHNPQPKSLLIQSE